MKPLVMEFFSILYPPSEQLTGVEDILCLCEISGFCRGDVQAFALLECYTA